MIKKRFLFIVVALLSLFLTSCMKKYTVTFDLNGGIGTVEEQVVKKNGLATKPVDPSKEGHTFNGWYLDGNEFSFDAKVTKDITLKANWEEVVPEMVTISFDTLGGTPEPEVQEVEVGSKAIKPADPTKEDFVFVSWYLGEALFDFDTPVDESITLEALWEAVLPEVEVVTITFELDGGTPLLEEVVIDKGSKLTKPANPTKDGFTFEGWYLNNKKYNFNDVVEEDITLIAKWEKVVGKTYYVYFDSDGGLPKTTYVTVNEGNKLRKPGIPVKKGWEFEGWFLNDEIYDFDVIVTRDMTLIARWIKVYGTMFDITFDSNGGTPELDPVQVEDGYKLKRPQEIPEKEGFEFRGWFKDGYLYDFDDEVTSDFTLVAEYKVKDPERISVYFEPNNGEKRFSHYVLEGRTSGIPVDPVKELHTFIYWADEDGNEYDLSLPVFEEFTLYAIWTKDIQITYLDTNQMHNPYSLYITKGTIPEYLMVFHREGYLFKGYLIDGVVYEFDTPLEEDTILMAIWEEVVPENPRVTVTLDANGGEARIPRYTVLKGTVPKKPANPVREHYYFRGWHLEGVAFNFDVTLEEDILLVAQWEEIIYVTVTFNAPGAHRDFLPQVLIKGESPIWPEDYPKRDDGHFIGWLLDGIEYEGDHSLYNFKLPVLEDITLNAYWIPRDVQHNVGFYGLEDEEDFKWYTVLDGEFLPEIPEPTKEGFIFSHWVYGDGNIFDLTEPIYEAYLLFPIWKEIKEYVTITFDSKGGTDVLPIEVEKGEKALKPADPTKDGFTFTGWNLEDVAFDFDTVINENIILEAVWEEVVLILITVTFDTDGGEPGQFELEVEQGTKLEKPKNPTKEDYIFSGWYLEDDLFDFNTPITKEITLIAYWTFVEDDDVIEIYYYSEHDEDATLAKYILKGTIPEFIQPFTRSGYNFVRYEINGEPYDFDTPIYEDYTYLEAVWEVIVQAYIGDVGYAHAYQAADNLLDGETLSLTADYDGGEFEIFADNVLVTKYKTQKAVVRENIYIYSENVTIKNLEFTEHAQIRFEDDVVEFRFEDNKVYDLSYFDNNDFNFNRRANVNSFIYFYHSTKYNLEDMVLLRNTFNNIKATVILVAPDTISGSLTFKDNSFTNIRHSAIRIDAGSNGGNLYIEDNRFENIEHNAIFVNGVGSEVKYTNFQILFINRNDFYKISESTVKPSDSELTRSVIIINDNIHEVPLNFQSEYNHFYLSSVAYYVDNAYNDAKIPVMKINYNHFEFIQWYALQQKYVKSVSSFAIDFTKNTFQSYNYDNLDDYDNLVSSKIINNGNYGPFYIDESLIYENEEVRMDATIYVSSLLENNENDEVSALGKTFIYGKSAFNSIQAALDISGSKDVIYLDPNGYYPEDFTVLAPGVSIISANAGTAYNDPNYTHVTAIIEGKISIRVSNVRIDGLRFSNNATISIASITGELKGFKFLNNTVNNYFGDKEPNEAFIQTLHYPNQQIVNNVYIIGNSFTSNMNLVPYIGENVRNLYVVNNNFQGKPENNNSAIVLRGTKGGYEGLGTTGRIFIARNKFENYGGDVVNIDYYNHMNLKVMHNEFLAVANRGIRVNKTDLENDLPTDIRVFNNKFTSVGGVPSYIQLVEQVYPTTLRVEYNDFETEARYYVQNTANTEHITVVNNLYRIRVSPSHFLNVDEFTEVEELPPYFGILE